MKCLIPGRFVKLFGRAVHCLSKIGDELYLEASEDGLALRTVNSSRSAFGCFLFNESFFHEYNAKSNCIDDADQDQEVQRFKISMKSCLGVFKSLNTIEKNVDTCKLEYDEKETRIVFKLFCRHGIVKTHNLTFQESESLQAVFSKDLCPNLIVAQAKVLIDTAGNFPNSCEEVTFCCTPESLNVKNYIEDEPDPSKIVHTEMTLHPEEFDDYRIGVDTDITFCLKEARAVLAFADFASQPVNIHFSAPGKPVVFSLDGDSLYVADFVLATLMEHPVSSQATQNGQSKGDEITSKARYANNKKAVNGKKHKEIVADRVENHIQDIEVDITGGENVPSEIDLRSVATPPYHGYVAVGREDLQGKDNVNIEPHGGEADDFFSESFPYKDMLERNSTEERPRKHEAIAPSSRSDARVNNQIDSQNRPQFSADIALPALGNSVNYSRDPTANAPFADDVLPCTPPSKKFKSLFFGTVTAPEEIRKRRKLHETVLAEDTDDES